MMKLFNLIFLCLVLFACSGNPKQKTVVQKEAQTKKEFKMVDVPIMYTTPENRAEFVALHYWDNFNFKDTSYVNLPNVTEQAWVDYLQVLSVVPRDLSLRSVERLIEQAQVDSTMLAYFEKLSDKYLYDPNSPMRNEDLYISVLQSLLASPIEQIKKTTFAYRLELAKKNRVGEKATDFMYTLENGKQTNLYGIKSEYTLLFISNPGCEACAEIMRALKSSPTVNSLLNEKRLVVFSFYPDEDLDEWKRHIPDIPSSWISGFDEKLVVKNHNLYDLRAIPTLYLLDKKKTVLLKDAPFDKIELYLNQLF